MKDPRIGTAMETRGRFTKGDHSTSLEVVDGASVGFTLAHVVHCTACGVVTSKPIPYTDDAEIVARQHINRQT